MRQSVRTGPDEIGDVNEHGSFTGKLCSGGDRAAFLGQFASSRGERVLAGVQMTARGRPAEDAVLDEEDRVEIGGEHPRSGTDMTRVGHRGAAQSVDECRRVLVGHQHVEFSQNLRP